MLWAVSGHQQGKMMMKYKVYNNRFFVPYIKVVAQNICLMLMIFNANACKIRLRHYLNEVVQTNKYYCYTIVA